MAMHYAVLRAGAAVGLVLTALGASAGPYRQAPKKLPAENVTISSGKTANILCTKDVCSPTGPNAVLNVKDLETLLAKSKIEVTTGNRKSKTGDITVTAPLSWTSASMLTLDAYNSILIEAHVAVKGAGGVAIIFNDGGTKGDFSFDPNKSGRISFANLASPLTIEGTSFTLVSDIATLASDIASNPGGYFALANSYDASKDGTYAHSPIQTTFTGGFEGLGNSIANLTIVDTTIDDPAVGFFSVVQGSGASDRTRNPFSLDGLIANIVFRIVSIVAPPNSCNSCVTSTGPIVGSMADGILDGADTDGTRLLLGHLSPGQTYNEIMGGLVGANGHGQIVNCRATNVSISGGNGTFSVSGGLVGQDSGGTIMNSSASGSVADTTAANTYTGGLVGYISGTTIENSSSSANVTIGQNDWGGGLVGWADPNAASTISKSSATGNVQGDSNSVGGLVGEFDFGTISGSHATGAVTGGGAGGLVGVNGGFGAAATISGSYATGAVTAGSIVFGVGGLVGSNSTSGTITLSYATGTVAGGTEDSLGGLVGTNSGAISESFATGATTGGSSGWIGGLVGTNGGSIANSYATGAADVVTGAVGVDIGGLVGLNNSTGTVGDSYSIGAVQQASESYVGGVVGQDESSNGFTDTYWDTTTSGITNLSQGAGRPANDPGLAGLTTTQLQSALPTGFSSSIWAESSTINSGLPYLLNNPPPH